MIDYLKIFTRWYGALNNVTIVPFWVLSPLRLMIRCLANAYLPHYLRKNRINESPREYGLIVSLTSYPARINDVWKVVECMKRQSVRPEKIILWLYKGQFPNEYASLPFDLINEIDDEFEVVFVDKNLRSHTKYYYAFKRFPDKTIITCDDDVYYDVDMIKRLIDTSKKYPNCITANHTRKIRYISSVLSPYLQWSQEEIPYDSANLLQLGVGGVLYPPYSMYELTLHDDIFMSIIPMADDIWLNCMARLKGTPIVQTSKSVLLMDIVIKTPKLTDINNGAENLNDKQIKTLRSYLIKNGLRDVYASDFYIKLDR